MAEKPKIPDPNNNLSFPLKIEHLPPKLNAELLKDFTGERTGFLQVGPKKYFMPSGYAQNAANYLNFPLRESDIWVVTFPRCGTTWTQEMVWLLSNGLDYKKARDVSLVRRFPFLEFYDFVHPETKKEFVKENEHSEERLRELEECTCNELITLEKEKGRRFIKTHLPFSLLPKDLTKIGCKVIYVARNPKDVAISFYHLNRSIRTQGYIGDFNKYWTYFENNLQPWTPFWEHLAEGWEQRENPNVLFMFYEDMTKDLYECIRKVSNFLEVKYDDQDIEKLAQHLHIENFKNNKSVNMETYKQLGILKKVEEKFVRTGGIGKAWKSYFSPELEKRADAWIEENSNRVGIRFPI